MQMISQFFDADLEGRQVVVKEGDTLELGNHTLHFVMAPRVHWPEVMVSYEDSEKILFSAAAFGTFGALNGNLFNDEVDFEKDWIDDARRYFTNIVGKYGMQVQALLKKAAGLDIQMICPLHGPVWRNNLNYFIEKHDKWSKYEPEDQAVAIIYGSIYGNTEQSADALAAIFELVKFANTNVSEASSAEFAGTLLDTMVKLCDVLGLKAVKTEEILDKEIEDLIAERQEARKAKNFARADEIRDELLAKGIILKDTREGVKWKRA